MIEIIHTIEKPLGYKWNLNFLHSLGNYINFMNEIITIDLIQMQL